MVDEFRSSFLNTSGQMNFFSTLNLKPRSLFLPWKRNQKPTALDTFVAYPFFPDTNNKPSSKSMRESTSSKTIPTRIFDSFRTISKEQELSDVVLTPSPGQQFWLKVDCRDGFFQNLSAYLSIEVRSVTRDLEIDMAILRHSFSLSLRTDPLFLKRARGGKDQGRSFENSRQKFVQKAYRPCTWQNLSWIFHVFLEF